MAEGLQCGDEVHSEGYGTGVFWQINGMRSRADPRHVIVTPSGSTLCLEFRVFAFRVSGLGAWLTRGTQLSPQAAGRWHSGVSCRVVRGLDVGFTRGRFHIETLLIYNFSSRKFTTQNDLY